MTTERPPGPAIPLVNATREARVPGVADMPDLRVEARVAPNRKNVVMTANPVFTGPAKDLPLPRSTSCQAANNRPAEIPEPRARPDSLTVRAGCL